MNTPVDPTDFLLINNATTYADAVITLAFLRSKIISLSDLTTDEVIITSYQVGFSSNFSTSLQIFQPVAGTVGNRLITQSASGTTRRPTLSSFSGGENGKITRGNAFARNVQLVDAVRIYTDSTGSAGAFDMLGGTSTFGLLQTDGGILPKYYFDSKKYGHFSDFLDQGKDSKFSQVVGKTLKDFKGSALQSPVEN